MGVNLVRKFIGGTFYTNKLGFKKFFPCSNENSAKTGHILKGFIELVGLPPPLHSYNHKNLKEGLFKWLFQKFGIIPTNTELHSPYYLRFNFLRGESFSIEKKKNGKYDRATKNMIAPGIKWQKTYVNGPSMSKKPT